MSDCFLEQYCHNMRFNMYYLKNVSINIPNYVFTKNFVIADVVVIAN